MSVKAVTWALEQEIDNPVSHLLLVNLADYADKEHKCWPGQDLLAKRLRRSVDTVQRHLRKLEKSKHIVSEHRADENGHRTSNLYRLNVDVVVGVVPPDSDVSQKPKPHQCGLGKRRLNRKTGSPKPQNTPRLNRTQGAVGTLEPSDKNQTRSRAKISNSDLKVKRSTPRAPVQIADALPPDLKRALEGLGNRIAEASK